MKSAIFSLIKMSFEKNYIRNLTHKYRLAVAIAVLKQKPAHLSLEEHIKELQNKINNTVDDLDLTICSDDFDLDENINNDGLFNNEIKRDTNDERNNLLKDTFANQFEASNGVNNDVNINRSINDEFGRKSLNKNNVHDAKGSYGEDSESIIKDFHENLKGDEIRNVGKINLESVNTTRREDNNVIQHQASQQNYSNDINTTFCETQTNDKKKHSTSNEVGNIVKDTLLINEVNLELPNEIHKDISNEKDISQTYYDSQATEIYSLHGNTENYSHISQSQYYDQIITNDKFIKTGSNKISSKPNMIIDKEESDDVSNKTSIITKNLTPSQNFNKDNSKNHKTDLPIEATNTNLSQDDNEIVFRNTDSNPTNLINQNSMQMNSFPQYAQNLNEDFTFINEPSENLNENIAFINEPIKNLNEDIRIENECNTVIEIDEEVTSNNDTEIVSFKVIEELNKVKNYLNRRIERRVSNDGSIDSGYKSDSQKSYFRSSLQLSGNWVNQSAHSLYNYVAQCPVLAATQEIVYEIAQVLGQLIDKLHEEEKYPSFLEELFENIDFLLREIYKGSGEDVLLKKDETIQRLLLLNKSIHIQKYTIEKIATILEELHTKLTNPEETLELSNIYEIENIPYIFHILEVILKRYSPEKVSASQEISNSQTELKKSSITDIWRKKWNPNYMEVTSSDLSPKKCVLLKCNEVLNKLIVSCMEGYSLISFLALQCFNVLQS